MTFVEYVHVYIYIEYFFSNSCKILWKILFVKSIELKITLGYLFPEKGKKKKLFTISSSKNFVCLTPEKIGKRKFRILFILTKYTVFKKQKCLCGVILRSRKWHLTWILAMESIYLASFYSAKREKKDLIWNSKNFDLRKSYYYP